MAKNTVFSVIEIGNTEYKSTASTRLRKQLTVSILSSVLIDRKRVCLYMNTLNEKKQWM